MDGGERRGMMGQLSFFCPESPPPAEENAAHEDEPALVYICTMRAPGRVLYKTTVRDAKKICGLKETSGIGRGGPWFLAYTTERNFLKGGGSLIDNGKERTIVDDGRFDTLFQAVGVEATPFSL
jgi:hypothetical protein